MSKPIKVSAVLTINGDYSPLEITMMLGMLDKHTIELNGKRATLTLTHAG